ncbi:MAG: hypothetical protein RL088_4013 [Verrucomicrobiota bacterium]|jgi:phage tail sheath protein FI
MPEYLAPGVFVEETSFRSKSIEGVSTSTTAFVGLSRRGAAASVQTPPELLTSFADFERMYGGLGDLELDQNTRLFNYIAHAVQGYFNEGGARLFFARVIPAGACAASSDDMDGPQAQSANLIAAPVGTLSRIQARVRGPRGNGIAMFNDTITAMPVASGAAEAAAMPVGTMILHRDNAAPPVETVLCRTAAGWVNDAGVATPLPGAGAFSVLTLDVCLVDGDGGTWSFDNLAYDPAHPRALSRVLAEDEARARGLFAWFSLAPAVTGHELRTAILALGVAPASGLREHPFTGGDSVPPRTSRFRSRFRGSGGNGRVFFSESLTPVRADALDRQHAGTIIRRTAGGSSTFFVRGDGVWTDANGVPAVIPAGGTIEAVTLNVTTEDADGYSATYEGLHYGSEHPSSIRSAFPQNPTSRDQQLTQLYWFDLADSVSAFALRDGIRGLPMSADDTAFQLEILNGFDGQPVDEVDWDDAFASVSANDDVSILASPGATELPNNLNSVIPALLPHEAERRRSYRMAVLDVPRGTTIAGAAEFKGAIDSKYAALYYPWVVVSNPKFNPNNTDIPKEILVPPSGFICGIYARNDNERGVHKAPANEVVRSALRFERQVLTGEQEMLNPLGVNCLRFFPGRGFRVWGARTCSSDPEWKYVNIRRYFNYLERSIDRGTQWAVFEPNGERLWANVKETITSFLYNEWVSGALLGTSPEQAFFVRCDRSTITQNDLDNGRLVCLVGVAAIKPAEFVIFRIGQKTADSK